MHERTSTLRISRTLSLLTVLGLLLSLIAPTVVVRAATLTVTNLNDSGAGSLRDTIAGATSGDTITFSVTGTIPLVSELVINKSLTITGPGANNLTLSGGGTHRVLNITSGTVNLSGLTIDNGNVVPGGDGGGILVGSGATLNLSNSTFSANYASAGGGIFNNGNTTITGSIFTGNVIPGGGTDGSAIWNNSSLSVSASTFSGNSGGSAILTQGASLTVDQSTFSNNGAQNGAAIYAAGSTTITNSTFTTNTSSPADGGALFVEQPTTITNSTFTGNSARNGGAIYKLDLGTTLTISGSTFNGNTASAAGSAIYNEDTLNLSTSTVSGNSGGCCGALFNAAGATMTVDRSTVSGNSAGNGGALFGNGTVTITNSTFNNNSTTTNDGGALFFTNLATITNSTISGNTTSSLGGGLVTQCGSTANVTITNSTVANNSAGSGGGLYKCGGTISIKNTIVASNSGGNCVGVTSNGYNITSDNSCSGGTGDLLNMNPQLGPLADNGGPTQTHAPQTGSPAIDAGDPAFTPPPATDQRGQPRVQNGRIDIGAVELVPPVIQLGNFTWPEAKQLTLTPVSTGVDGATVDEHLAVQDQSAWFKFTVQPGAQVAVSLTNLPANYDLVLYKDILAAYQTLITSQQQLVRQSAQFAPNYITPNYITPNYITPGTTSTQPSPEAYSSAQMRSLLTYSARDGAADELVVQNTWDNAGDYYVRVRGRDGAFSTAAPFRIQVSMFTGACSGISPINTASTIGATAGNYKTIILTDLGRMEGGDADNKSTLWTKLGQFAARPEIAGKVINVGQYSPLSLNGDARVIAANTQADMDVNLGCPYAKNVVAATIKELIDKFRAVNPVEYIVIVGNDGVIPFFRQPEQVDLGKEQTYDPPVGRSTISQAALKLSYVLSQDRYGSQVELSSLNRSFPIPNLPVGRLVETPAEVIGVLDAYGRTNNGVVPTPTSSLVTGYDFLTRAAQAVQKELEAGIGLPADALVTPMDQSVNAPACTGDWNPTAGCNWTAEQLRTKLLGSRHDLIYLAAHFNQGSALAADYKSTVSAAELAQSPINLENTIIFSTGCHAGYNTVNGDAVAGVTDSPDWAEAAAQKRAALIAGTGYQYGDTDYLAYSARLYAEFSKQLRVGSGPVAIGTALVAAKNAYLAGTPTLNGIDDKSVLQTTLYGLPMLKVDMPFQRIPATNDPSIVSGTTAIGSQGLSRADVRVTPSLTTNTRTLTNVSGGETVTATYLSGANGVAAASGQPTLPLELRNVSVPYLVARGVGFRSGFYTDLQNIVPLTSAPSTELSGVHQSFSAPNFFPNQPWNLNYFDALANSTNGRTRLAVTPAQFMSSAPGAQNGTLRKFTDMNFRVYYSSNLSIANAGAPTIGAVAGIVSGNTLTFSVTAQGDRPAPVQEVWVTYTATSGSLNGNWQSLDLVRSASDPTIWTGSLTLDSTTSASNVRFFVQAVNGSGLVTMDTNVGAYYTPGPRPTPATKTPTTLTLQSPPTSGAYTENAQFSAVLRDASGAALAGKPITFNLGSQSVLATTDSAGKATATLQLIDKPDQYTMTASFAETNDLLASEASAPFTIRKLGTTLSLASTTAGQYTDPTPVVATLKDSAGRALFDKTVFFVVNGPGGPYRKAIRTDYQGWAALKLALPSGSYTFEAYFGQDAPLDAGATLPLSDDQYGPSSQSVSLTITDRDPPVIAFLPNLTIPATSPSGATGTWTATATDANPAQPAVSCSPASGSNFPIGMTTVSCSATDTAGNTATRTFTIKVAYRLSGFYQPVDMSTPPFIVYNTVKGGATVPIKFEIFAGGTEITDVSLVNISTAVVSCVANASEDAVETPTSDATSLRYDVTSGQFIYNWKTPRESGKCYRLTMTAKDGGGSTGFTGGSTLVAYFKLK